MEHDLGGRASDVVAAIALAATTNTTLLALTAASRNMFAMARSGSLPTVISSLGRSRAPWVAALLGLGAAGAAALTADIGLAASVTDFAVYAIFIVVNVSVIVRRKTQPDIPRPMAVPGAYRGVALLPIAAIATVIVMLARLGIDAWILGSIALCAGAAVWVLVQAFRGRRDSSPA
jgi:APA family basic amino acid/polyamine antiporter